MAAPGLALRIGLRAVLQSIPEIQVAGEAATLAEAITLSSEADVLLIAGDPAWTSLDFHQPAGSEELRGLVVLSDQLERAAGFIQAWGRPAWGVLSSAASPEELAVAIQGVYEGLIVGAPELLAKVLAVPEQRENLNGEHIIELTNREREVLQFLAQGLANKQIGLALGISEHTVKFHVSGIYTKLGATNRTEAVRMGLQRGLISL
jgi:DNA-binding NarL/FixJ family response regulator